MHVAIIMDGNGRWAEALGRPRLVGHEQGARRIRAVVEASPALGIDVLTLYAFSADNWKRPPSEVTGSDGALRPVPRRRRTSASACGCSADGDRPARPAVASCSQSKSRRLSA